MGWMMVITMFVVAIKVPHLFLPGYWDEAWSYLPAVAAMKQTLPGLWPGVIDVGLYKGHPLLFFFLHGVWGHLVDALWWSKVLALGFSIGLLWQVYATGKRLFGEATGLWATAALAVHGMFIAQATLVLPEILLAWLVLLGIDRYWQQRYWATGLWLTAAVFTKESALALAAAVGIHFVVSRLLPLNNWLSKERWRQTFPLLLPAVLYGLFLIWQHQLYGWWLYPDHVDRMELSVGTFLHRMRHFADFCFTQYGMIVLLIPAILSLVVLLVKRQLKHASWLLFAAWLILAFWVFSALNFYSARYFLLLLPIILLSLTRLIASITTHQVARGAVIVITVGAIGLSAYTRKDSGDANPWHVQMIQLHDAAIDTLVTTAGKDELVATHFLMQINLTEPAAGYVTEASAFTNVEGWAKEGAQWFITSSIEYQAWMPDWEARYADQLWWADSNQVGWVKIYRPGL